MHFLSRNRSVLIYGTALAVLLLLLKWLEWKFIVVNHYFELYAGAIALTFTLLGIWLAAKLFRPGSNSNIERENIDSPNSVLTNNALHKLGLSKREMEVLALMAEGLSNQEIGGRLFVSLNTVKTHCSRIFEKLEVTRRTQAVEKARRLHLLP